MRLIQSSSFPPLPGFLGAQGFGADDEQGSGRVQAGDCGGEIAGIDIGAEVHATAIHVPGSQCVHHHSGAKIGTAYTQVDDIGDGFAGVARVAAIVHPGNPGRHSFQALLYRREFLFQPFRRAAGAQQGMQHCPAFGVVKGAAVEQPLARTQHPRGVGESQQRIGAGAFEQVPGKIQPPTRGLDRKRIQPARVRIQCPGNIHLSILRRELLEKLADRWVG